MDTNYLTKIPVSTVTFVRVLEEDWKLQKELHKPKDWGMADLLAYYRKAVRDELRGLDLKVLRVVDALAWSDATDASDDALNGRSVDFWDGDYRVTEVRVCVQIVGDVADELLAHAKRAEITNSYILGNAARRYSNAFPQGSTGAGGDGGTCLPKAA
jgi:hypothetical protein